MNFTDEEKSTAARREVTMRKSVYPRRVRDGKMLQATADREIAIMQEIADEYAEKDRLPF